MSIAIIGAGLSGLTLALALHKHQIPFTIHESRPSPLDIGGSLMISPNSLRALDALGIYDLLPPSYRFQTLHFRTQHDEPLDTFPFGSASAHGYDGMRISRSVLIGVLLAALADRGITPVYGSKFLRVLSEDDTGVTWLFADGSTGKASILIGADGIHSRVRSHIAPEATPKFTNMIGVTAAVPAAQLGPAPFLPLTITHSTHGAFVAAPQGRDGAQVLIGKQCRVDAEPDREGWARMSSDKQWCIDFLRRGSEEYPPVVARAVADIDQATVNLWPFYVIPKLESWASPKARVVILGDAAHAIPPTAGQGVNQAFEDVYLFALVMARLRQQSHPDVPSALRLWQQKRQARVDRVLELNAMLNKRRLPSETGEQEAEPVVFDLDWLYNVNFENMADEIMAEA